MMCKPSPWSGIITRYQSRVDEVASEQMTLQTSVLTLTRFFDIVDLRRDEFLAEREMLLAYRASGYSTLEKLQPAKATVSMAADADAKKEVAKPADDEGAEAAEMTIAALLCCNDLIQTIEAKAFDDLKLQAVRIPPPVPEVITAPNISEMPRTCLGRDPTGQRVFA